MSGHRPALSESSTSSSVSISSLGSTAELLNETKPSSKWPRRPMPLKRARLGFALRTSIDLLLYVATAPFITLGVFAAVRNGKPADEKEWDRLQLAMKMAVTTFPIIFAAIMGRLTKNLATWRLERGISLGHLEQLLGSSSVFGTFSTQVLMGSFNMLAVGLFVLWALSPLGGQSSLHIIRTVPSLTTASKDVSTFNTEIPSPFDAVRRPLSFIGPQLNGLYVTSLMAPPNVKHSPVDIWGNLKVPLMSHLASDHTSNGTCWYNFDADVEDIPYSSLIGIPVGGLQPNGNTTFTMESSYFDVNCYSLSLSSYVPTAASFAAPLGADISTTKSKDVPRLLQIPNNTFYGKANKESSFTVGIDSYIDWNAGPMATLRDEGMSSVVRNVTGNKKTFYGRRQTFLFESKLPPVYPGVQNPATVAYCNIGRVYVESAVSCISNPLSARRSQCSVAAVRNSQVPHQPADITPFLFPSILGSDGGGKLLTHGEILNDTDTPLLVQDVGMKLFSLDRNIFSQRLTQVINTHYMASLFPSAMVGGLDTQLPIYTVSQYTSAPINRTTTATVISLEHNLYATNVAWLIVFLATSTVMLMAATISSTLPYFTTIPDVLGYASSLTRDSVYFPHAANTGSVLDGLTRSRKLKEKKVRLGDVRCHERVGLLAFSEADAAARGGEDEALSVKLDV
ncbi:hypothetical protein AJ79_00550 [Helicocarpus griseus UAMH5409]|uniref:Uncharacterized protein n=1 Tax=Helicocarpus griseus UAMH5409 TaxID=1447875 RepID=A0A2B7YBG3_9EURO|nr:hypothetical protein AJ79_00550 [Helicocarpus griseus UAMH5409]